MNGAGNQFAIMFTLEEVAAAYGEYQAQIVLLTPYYPITFGMFCDKLIRKGYKIA